MNSKLFKEGVEICDDKFLLKVTKDRLEAYVFPKDREAGLTIYDVDLAAMMQEVKSQGINYGLLDEPQVREDGTYRVAQGLAAVQGENAKIQAYVKPAVVRSPKSTGNDQVDFRELGSIVNVPKDKLLLEKIPPTSGTPGKTVTSEIINAKAGKDINIKVGPGVALSADGRQVTSTLDGKYMLADGKASVMVEHTVLGNVDMSVGNIAFVGERLMVNGSVEPGFKVKCKNDIYIAQGVQNGAEVTAGRSLEIKGGVIGADVVLKCWGDIKVDFVENVGRIEAKEDLIITETIIQGKARVGGDLKVLTGKGTLIGGKFIVGGSAYFQELGSEAEVVTEISVGINPQLEAKKKELDAGKEIWPAKMNEIIKNTTALKKMQKDAGGTLPPDKAELLKKLNAMLPEVMEKVNDLSELEKELDIEIEKTINEAVYVYGKLYPGTTITICGISRTMVTEEERVVVHFDKATRQIHCRKMTPQEVKNPGEPAVAE